MLGTDTKKLRAAPCAVARAWAGGAANKSQPLWETLFARAHHRSDRLPGQQDARIVNITKNDAQSRSEEVLANQHQVEKSGNDPILVVYGQ